MKRSFGISSLLLVFSLLVASCSADTPGEGPQSPVLSVLPGVGVPRVEHPLNTSLLEKDSCNAVTREQIESLGKPISSTVNDSDSKLTCVWKFESGSYISLGVPPEGQTVRGLSDIYDLAANSGLDPLKPITISGYPAVIFLEQPFGCSIAVGVRDDKIVRLISYLGSDSPYSNSPCEAMKKVGEFMISYLAKS